MSAPVTIYCRNLDRTELSEPDPSLTEGESHIFCFHINRQNILNDYGASLTTAELEKASRFVRPSDAGLYAAARIFPKRVLQFYADDAFEIISDPQHKPQIRTSNPDTKLYFNLSHTEGLLMMTISHAEVGIDAELIKPEMYEDLIQDCFSHAEQELIHRSGDPAKIFYMLWTRKESLLKADGIGLIDNLPSVEVCADANTLQESGYFKYESYHISSALLNGHVFSICNTRGSFEQLKFFDGFAFIKKYKAAAPGSHG